MPDPSDLLSVAREAQLRRAVSTAYYPLFHKVLGSGAERFMEIGKHRTVGYSSFYRSFNHGRMKSICEALNVPTLSKTLQQQLGRAAVSQEMRDFAGDFVALREKRQLADYDPAAIFVLSDSTNQVDIAEAAMTGFDRVAPDEKADVLALMLSNSRG